MLSFQVLRWLWFLSLDMPFMHVEILAFQEKRCFVMVHDPFDTIVPCCSDSGSYHWLYCKDTVMMHMLDMWFWCSHIFGYSASSTAWLTEVLQRSHTLVAVPGIKFMDSKSMHETWAWSGLLPPHPHSQSINQPVSSQHVGKHPKPWYMSLLM